ncbi:cilia- and flagella-associated protein 70 isoform X2 [Anabrus simplex]|uniref:cilia- and flagella-associated protein 70 isoform X2 n=1 Tax=Anabrus simplex TaxID=316456 RepID=UPI0035A34B77
MKYCIWSLMGHCHYKLNDMPKAMEYYHQIETLDDPPHDMHLVSIRLGNCYLKYKQHKEAEKILYAISLVSPSTMTWCYLGIALYEQRKYLEAEMALSEALRLDSSCPIVWAYLALINLQHEREWEYEQCFQQAIDVSSTE